jgi:predicted metal-dependent hydrolase
MNTETYNFAISGMNVEVVRKPIKNLHLGVYPPHGRIRVAAPLALTKDAIRLAVVDKIVWIKRQKAKFEAQARQTEREMVTGETHYFQGRRYRLRVIEHAGRCTVMLQNKTTIHLFVRRTTSRARREAILHEWYRQQLKELIPSLVAKWSTKLGVKAPNWGVRKMKTRRGSCNAQERRIWLNLELAKKSVNCLEYIIIHELVHLLERHHNDRFVGLMDKSMPGWRACQTELNASVLGHEQWTY